MLKNMYANKKGHTETFITLSKINDNRISVKTETNNIKTGYSDTSSIVVKVLKQSAVKILDSVRSKLSEHECKALTNYGYVPSISILHDSEKYEQKETIKTLEDNVTRIAEYLEMIKSNEKDYSELSSIQVNLSDIYERYCIADKGYIPYTYSGGQASLKTRVHTYTLHDVHEAYNRLFMDNPILKEVYKITPYSELIQRHKDYLTETNAELRAKLVKLQNSITDSNIII